SQVDGLLELEGLLGHPLHQVLGEDLWEARDVEDVLLRVQRRELTAHLVEVVDQTAGGPAHSRVKSAEQSGRAGADNRDIFDVLPRAAGDGPTRPVHDWSRARHSRRGEAREGAARAAGRR